MTFPLLIPPTLVNVVQSGLLERAFHDSLFPELLFRDDAEWEEWPENSGTEILMTRRGQLSPNTKPLVPGQDPSPKVVNYEQWVARLERYGDTIDVHMPTSAVAASSLFLSDIHALGMQAGQSLNRLPRNEMFRSYLSGHTVLVQATLTTDVQIRVAALNGFTDVVLKGQTVRPQPVSPALPLPITINGVAKNVIGAQPDNADDPFGPGTLTLSTTVGAVVAARAPVLSNFRPRIIRSGGGSSVDALTSGDTFVIQDAINAASQLRTMNVPPHADGWYHAHISNNGNAQVFTDPAYQRLQQGQGSASEEFKRGLLGVIGGVAFYLNNENPDDTNSGDTTSTGTNAKYSADIGAETVNENGVRVGRILVTGRGILREKGLDEKAFITEAGVTGKVGDFQVENMGISIKTDRIKLLLRAPLNRTMDQVAATWTISTSFSSPTDVITGTAERYKRGIIIEHSLD